MALKNSFNLLLLASLAAVTTAQVYVIQKDFNLPNNNLLTTSANETDCRAQCSANSQCIGTVTNTATNSCVLKNGTASTTAVVSSTGNDFSRKVQVYDMFKGIDFPGTRIACQSAPATVCQKLCTDASNCYAYTRNAADTYCCYHNGGASMTYNSSMTAFVKSFATYNHVALKASTTLGTIRMPADYELSFTMILFGTSSQTTSVLVYNTGNINESRHPGIYVVPNTSSLLIHINLLKGFQTFTSPALPLNVVIGVRLLVFGTSVRLYLNNDLAISASLTDDRQKVDIATAYMSDSFNPAAYATVQNINLKSLVTNDLTTWSRFTPISEKLVAGWRLGSVIMPNDYEIFFKLIPLQITKDAASIFRIRSQVGDCCEARQRLVGLWFLPGSFKLRIRVGVDTGAGTNNVVALNTDYSLVEAAVYNMRLSVIGNTVRLFVNEFLSSTITIPSNTSRPMNVGEAEIWTSDEYSAAANARLSEFRLMPVQSQSTLTSGLLTPQLLRMGNVWGVADFRNDWEVEFFVTPLSIPKDWSNLIHCTGNSHNLWDDVSRVIGISFWPNSLRLSFSFGIPGVTNWSLNPNRDLKLNLPNRVKVSVVDGVIKIFINEDLVETNVLQSERTRTIATVYVSSPWGITTDAYLTDLYFKSILPDPVTPTGYVMERDVAYDGDENVGRFGDFNKCIEECNKNPSCLRFTYDRTTGDCQLKYGVYPSQSSKKYQNVYTKMTMLHFQARPTIYSNTAFQIHSSSNIRFEKPGDYYNKQVTFGLDGLTRPQFAYKGLYMGPLAWPARLGTEAGLPNCERLLLYITTSEFGRLRSHDGISECVLGEGQVKSTKPYFFNLVRVTLADVFNVVITDGTTANTKLLYTLTIPSDMPALNTIYNIGTNFNGYSNPVTFSNPVKIYQLDGGIAPSQDLTGDLEGRVKLIDPCSFNNLVPDDGKYTEDTFRHGAEIASTMTNALGNQLNVYIENVRVGSSRSEIKQYCVVKGVTYAVRDMFAGTKIIALPSFPTKGDWSAGNCALEIAFLNQILVVRSAGNDGIDLNTVSTNPLVLHTSALCNRRNEADTICAFANYGSPVDLWVQGFAFNPTQPGTSYSTPFIAVLAASVVQKDPSLRNNSALLKAVIMNDAAVVTANSTRTIRKALWKSAYTATAPFSSPNSYCGSYNWGTTPTDFVSRLDKLVADTSLIAAADAALVFSFSSTTTSSNTAKSF